MDYLKPSNLVREGAMASPPITAEGKRVVIIGGGDTGADCLGTAHRQGAASVHQLEILPRPPDTRPGDNPWPTWPLIFRTSFAYEEGCERLYEVTTTEFVGDTSGNVRALRCEKVEMSSEGGRVSFEPVSGGGFELGCDLVLLAMGFVGTERRGIVSELGLGLDRKGNVACDLGWRTSRDGVFVCGDVAAWPESRGVGDRRRTVLCRQCRPLAHGRDIASRTPRSGPARHSLRRAGLGRAVVAR